MCSSDLERVKSSLPVNLLKTYLVLNIISEVPHLSADIEFIASATKEYYQLRLIVLESLSIRKDTFGEIYKNYTVSDFIVRDGEKIVSGTTVAQTKLLCKSKGQIKNISTNNKATRSILILTQSNQKVINIQDKTPQVSVGDLVKYGDQIAEGIIAPEIGRAHV